ncbi:sensor histidine kinase [Desulfosporosinus sp. FKB]|uniref:ATP-binding protein n=1 Tax=Desulfosporosinus sp. FKB TaxID=1969835 RepID=UPI000B49D0E5|nr:sensor histidine kinase [Desulfosporosinus sp. FKB]
MPKLNLQKRFPTLAFMMLIVPIAGQYRIYPFDDSFRVSLGTPTFFFFLLFKKKINPLVAGLLVGISVSCFRLLLGITTSKIGTLNYALISNIDALFYYLTYGAFFFLFRIKRFSDKPLLMGILAACAEILASLAQILVRHILIGMSIPNGLLVTLAPIAIIRSFLVLGFYSIFAIREAQLLEEQQQQRIDLMLVEISNLFVETIQLKKSIKNSEEATRACYTLYRHLTDTQIPQNQAFAQTALKLAGEIHEIKKDNQRIYAGLSKIISDKNFTDYINVNDLGTIIQEINEKYAKLIGKNLDFKICIQGEHPSYYTYTVFSILNNLVSNAVEAIVDAGRVLIFISRCQEDVEFKVCDNGPGIPAKIQSAIFEYGFTTKFDISGRPSTGIGLSYIKDVTGNLGGTIQLLNEPSLHSTCFLVRVPIKALMERG